jgi:hypothetical protein
LDSFIKKYFQILGVSQYASLEETKQAYKDLAKVWHPDRFIDNPRLQKKATEKFKEINTAYTKLLSFYENKNSLKVISAYSGVTHEKSFAEPHPSGPVDETRSISKDYRFLIWMLAICTLVILTIVVIIYTDFKSKRPDSNISPVISIPDQTKSSKPAATEPSTGKSTFHNRLSIKTTNIDIRKLVLTKKEYFTLGSTTDDVLAAQGTPTQISGNRWSYGFSYIDFENGRVVRWYNSKLEPLNVKMVPVKTTEMRQEYFTLGSTTDDVLAAQGTPTQISGNRWSYGFSYIDFENGRVVRWYESKQDPLLVEHEP